MSRRIQSFQESPSGLSSAGGGGVAAGAQVGVHCGEGGEVQSGQSGHWPAEVDGLTVFCGHGHISGSMMWFHEGQAGAGNEQNNTERRFY